MTKRIDGKARADRLLADIAAATAKLKAQSAIVPGLCAVLVGDDPASEVYVRNKGKAAVAAGIASFQETLPATITEAALLGLIGKLNADDRVDGILVQLPLPPHIDRQRVIAAIDPAKDVDGFHAQNVGRLWSGGAKEALLPCTPYGCLLLLPIWGILRQTGGNDPSGFVFIYTGEVKRRQDMHCLQPAFRQGAKMSHAVGVLVVKGFIQAAMSRWNREVIYAEVANMQLIQAQIAEASQRRR